MPFKQLAGRDVLLCDMIYQRASKKTNWKDYLTVVYRDLVLDTKERMVIEEPTINLFIVKPEYRNFKKQRHFLSKDRVETKTVKYRNVLKEIAKIAGPGAEDFYRNADYKDKKRLYEYPYCMGADIDIETYYRTLWAEEVGYPERVSPSKIFLDIEVDQINYEGNIAKNGECPVNAVSILDDKSNRVHTFLYNDGNNPQIADFINDQDGFQKRLHQEFDERNGIFDYKIYMFNNELEMIIQVFKLINTLCRDFSLIWNMGYDIPYLIARISALGINPSDVMCTMDFPTDTLYYYDDKNSFDWANKRSYFSISAPTHYSDQCINYASLRKSQSVVKKVNLDAIAEKEHVPGKVTYKTKATIRTLPYVDYVLFVLYNIGDVLTQAMIERKTKDIDNLYNIAATNNIGYTDALKQTVTFRGLMYGYLKKRDIVLGHNINRKNANAKYDENGDKIGDDDDDDESFEGAINGDPLLNMKNGLNMYGSPSQFLYGIVIDFDFSSMYPNSICAFNIFATTMIGKLIILNYELKNPYDIDMGKEYIEDVIAGDMNHIGTKWHNLSPIETLMQRVKERYNV